MSTGQGCALVEAKPGEWWLLLERLDYDEDERVIETDDWSATGPFASDDETRTYLHAHHANPGSSDVYHHGPARPETPFQCEIEHARKTGRGKPTLRQRLW